MAFSGEEREARGEIDEGILEVAIIGSGFGGLCMAIRLLGDGVRNLRIFERADAIGGTWRDNTYPGCACDVPAHLYSYSFETYAGWSRVFARQPEIRAYVERVAERYDLHRYVELGSELCEASYDEDSGIWLGRLKDGRTFRARYLVVAKGSLVDPAYPEVPGVDGFAGSSFHSARWNHRCDLAGKRVAVLGTGASTVQFLPEIQPTVEQLTLFQRTPPWVLPRPDRAYTERERARFERWSLLRRLHRAVLYGRMEWLAIAFTRFPGLMRLVARKCRRHIEDGIRDPELRALVTPDYLPGCKRLLLSNDYYPALDQPNVRVVTGGAAEIRPHGVVDVDGHEHPADVLIFGTGFRVHDYLGGMRLHGLDNVELGELWSRGATAYKGTLVAGFPNLFILAGPNVGLGHSSIIYMIESQVDYVMRCLRYQRARELKSFHVRAEVQARYNARIRKRLSRTVWNLGGCGSWYLDAEGRNVALWPGFTFEFRREARRFDPDDFHVEPAVAAV